jgi:AcrR family transcriptional regulator
MDTAIRSANGVRAAGGPCVNGVRDASDVRVPVLACALVAWEDAVEGVEVGSGRRERVRRETWRELRSAALDEVRAVGGAGLSLRAVARRMGMSPAGLYRYVASREALLTVLIAEGFHDLADYLEVALGIPEDRVVARDRPSPDVAAVAPMGRDPAERLAAVALAYRSWAVTHPNEFGLLFGDPIPEYDAPADGPTVEAMRRVGAALARPILEAHRVGRLRVHPALTQTTLTERMAPMRELDPDLPGEVAALLLLAWGRLHGQVSLEVFGHHRWLLPEGCEDLYRAEVARTADELLQAGGP